MARINVQRPVDQPAQENAPLRAGARLVDLAWNEAKLEQVGQRGDRPFRGDEIDGRFRITRHHGKTMTVGIQFQKLMEVVKLPHPSRRRIADDRAETNDRRGQFAHRL